VSRLSWDQAIEVAKRMDPRPGQVVVFAPDGTVLTSPEAQRGVARMKGEVYACRREPGSGVVVARLPHDHLAEGREPEFGRPW